MLKIVKDFKENSILIIRILFYCENKCQYFRDLIKSVDHRFVKTFRHSMINLNLFFRSQCSTCIKQET